MTSYTCSPHWELVGEAPAELLCEEVRDPSPCNDLRELGRVAKGIRQPKLQEEGM